jgi:hypothetical protein
LNAELKHIFSIEMNREYDEKLLNTYTHALKQHASKKFNDPSILDKPYHPGIAWLVYKNVDEKTNINTPKWWIPFAVDTMETVLFKDEEKVSMKYKENTPEDDATIERAKYLIGKVWPEALEQIELFVSDILLFDANGLYNNTSNWFFGAILLSYSSNRNTSINMMDFLLHESGHLVLMAKQAFDKLLLNPNDTAYSPIRATNRPLTGLFHLIYVSSRVCEGLIRLAEIESELTIKEKELMIERFEFNLNNFKEALSNLDAVAQYTEMGEYFMNQLREKLKVLETKKTVFQK